MTAAVTPPQPPPLPSHRPGPSLRAVVTGRRLGDGGGCSPPETTAPTDFGFASVDRHTTPHGLPHLHVAGSNFATHYTAANEYICSGVVRCKLKAAPRVPHIGTPFCWLPAEYLAAAKRTVCLTPGYGGSANGRSARNRGPCPCTKSCGGKPQGSAASTYDGSSGARRTASALRGNTAGRFAPLPLPGTVGAGGPCRPTGPLPPPCTAGGGASG
jgi:hypothetical protein